MNTNGKTRIQFGRNLAGERLLRNAVCGVVVALSVWSVCAGESVWTDAANDGKWTTADNWDDGLPSSDDTVSIARDSGTPYAVSLDAGAPQQVISNLYVGGSAASLTVAGNLKLDGGRFSLTNGATMSVVAGGSVMIDQLSQGIDANKQVAFGRIVGGSVLNLAGDFTLTNAAGRFNIGDDSYAVTSKVVQTGGTFLGRMNQFHGGIWLYKGGRIEVSGGKWDMIANPGYSSFLSQRGGDIEFSGNAEVDVGGFFAFGSGHTVFRGNSIWRTKSWQNINVPVDIPALVEVTENANIQTGDDGALRVGATSGRKATLVMRSAADSQIAKSLTCGRAGSTWGRVEIQSAYNHVDYYGIQLGACGDSPTATESPTGIVDVAGGVLDVYAGGWGWSKGNLHGIVIGSGIKRATNRTTACYNGFFSLSGDGVVTNRYGWFAVGAGPAYGEYRQTGGLFNHSSAQAVCVGQFGGEGHVDITGGTMILNGPLYIGGAKTNELGRYIASDTVPFDEHGGTGTFAVSNATVTLLKDAFIGLDGNGTLTVGPGADVTGTSLYVTNDWLGAVSTLKFVLGAETAGKLTLSGKLHVNEVANVVVDTSACTAKTPFSLLEATGIEGLKAEDVTVVDAARRFFKVTVTDTEISVCRASGFTISFR